MSVADSYPLHSAIRDGRIDDFKALITRGSDVNEKDTMSRTPLHIAAWKGNSEAVQVLLRAKAVCNTRAKDNFTALHFAAMTGDVLSIQLLTKADKSLIHCRISKGKKTALHLAVSKGYVEAVRALLQAGAELTATTSKGETALDIAKQLTKSEDDNFAAILHLLDSFDEATEVKKSERSENKRAHNAMTFVVEAVTHPSTSTLQTNTLGLNTSVSSEPIVTSEPIPEIVIPRKNKKTKRNIVISNLTSIPSDEEN